MGDLVSLVVQSRGVQRYINTIQTDMIDRGNEVTTGKKQNLVSELGGEIRNYLDLQSTRSSLMNRQERLQTGDNRLAQMGISLEMMQEQTTDYQSLIAQIGIVDRGTVDIYIDQATSTLQSMKNALNIQWGGRYLFAGDDVLQQPVESFDPLQTAIEGIIDEHALAAGGTLTTQVQVDALMTEIDSIFDNTHPSTLDPLLPDITYDALTYSGGDGEMAGIEIAEGDVMQFGIKANDDVFKDAIKGYMLLVTEKTFRGHLEGGSAGRETTALENDYLKNALSQISASGTAMIEERASVGFKQERIERTSEGLDSIVFQYEQRIGLFENADQYEAGIAFSELQRQLEASYYVTASLGDQSLLNYL